MIQSEMIELDQVERSKRVGVETERERDSERSYSQRFRLKIRAVD